MRIIRLPASAINLDEELNQAELGFDRVVRVILSGEGVILGSTDTAFFLVYTGANNNYSYVARSTLYRLLTSQRGESEPIVRTVWKALRKAKTVYKPYLALALIDEALASHIFFLDRDISSPADLVEIMIEYARDSGLVEEVDTCKRERDRSARDILDRYFSMLGEILRRLNSRIDDYGFTDSEEPCVIIGGKPYVIPRGVEAVVL